MGSSAFESLHALPGVFSAVQVSALTSASEIQPYISAIDAVRMHSRGLISKGQPELEKISPIIQVPLPDYFVDCAAVITVSSALQRTLSIQLQSASRGAHAGALPQEETHLLVDLWGQVEASRALFEFVIRQTEQFGVSSSIKSESLRAQYRVLLSGVERLILEVGTQFGERLTMSAAAVAIDWGLRRLRDAAYLPLSTALDAELSGLNV